MPGARHRIARRLAVVVAIAALPIAAASATAGYEEVVVADGGILAGTVRFVGAVPKLDAVEVSRHRDVCGARKPPEALVVGPDRGVRGGVILIEGVHRGKRSTTDVVIDSAKCVFVPHVAATTVGARVRVKNSDPILHNPHGILGQASAFSAVLPHKEQIVDITRRLMRPGVVRIVCDPHPHMLAWLVVHDSPYVATTDERGAYRIDGIPPGTYRVTMWHEGFRRKATDAHGRAVYEPLRTATRTVTIAPGTTVTQDFELR